MDEMDLFDDAFIEMQDVESGSFLILIFLPVYLLKKFKLKPDFSVDCLFNLS